MPPRPKIPFRLLPYTPRQFIRHSSSTSSTTLLPSVQVLLHTHNLSADSITPTGPKQNILKSDVLAAIGTISASVPVAQAERADKLAHLDLSNIVIATPAPKEETSAPTSSKSESTEPPEEELLPISIPISLAPLLTLQQKLSEKLGTAPSLSTLLARAVAVANTALPASRKGPSADELFEELVSTTSYKSLPKVSDGKYIPLVANASELPASEFLAEHEEDVYDILTSTPKKHSLPSIPDVPSEQPGAINVFALVVPPEEEKRALTFLERLRDVVEGNPGRLIGL